MPLEYDVAVLGAGIAGSAAALAAAESGARVCVISAAPAATALFSGAWRGPCPDRLRSALRAVGYELHTCHDPLPHPAGALVPCDLTTRSHRAARLRDGALVCGITGLPGFDAPALAQLWSARSGATLGADTIALPATPRAGWAPASLAAFIERDPAALTNALRDAASRHGAKTAIIPAVLGVGSNDELHERVAKDVDCEVGEALGTAPSLPGWRLHHALQRALAANNIAVLAGRALAPAVDARRVRAVSVDTQAVHARTFILATGKFAAGGIAADGVFRETALGCPVWIEHLGADFDGPDPLILTDPVRTQDQPLLRAGVHVNENQQPVNREDDVVYENVLVAGTVRSEWAAQMQGIGDCAQDGWRAGTLAVQT